MLVVPPAEAAVPLAVSAPPVGAVVSFTSVKVAFDVSACPFVATTVWAPVAVVDAVQL